MKSKLLFIIAILVSANLSLFAQEDTTKTSIDTVITETGIDKIHTDHRLRMLTFAGDDGFLWSKERPTMTGRWSIGGFARFYGYMDNLDQRYPGSWSPSQEGKNFYLHEEGYYEPTINMNISGRAGENCAFTTQVSMYNNFNNDEGYAELKPYFMLQFNGTMNTDFANISMVLGGLSWVQLTDMTLGSISKLGRYSIFGRQPYEGVNRSAVNKYENYYGSGTLDGGPRWGNREFNGLNLSATGLPLGLTARALYGKSAGNGSYTKSIPNSCYGGQLRKNKSQDEYISYQTWNKSAWSDSLDADPVGYGVHTVSFYRIFGDMVIAGEVGAGEYHSPSYTKKWSEGINLKAKFPNLVVPIEIQAYQLGSSFVNQSAGFSNTSIREANLDYTDTLATESAAQVTNDPFSSPMSDIGDMSNNRRGFNLNIVKDLNPLKVDVGIGISQEINAITNQITYGRRINGLIFNQMICGWNWTDQPVFGAYQRDHGYYRGVYSTVNIIDTTESAYAKNFSNLQFQLKYTKKLGRRNMYAFYNGAFKSVQPDISPIPKFNDDAWIRTSSHEVDVYVEINKKLMVCLYAGMETIKGNNKTDIDTGLVDVTAVGDTAISNNYVPSMKPRDQKGTGFGVGLDYVIGKNVGLYIRQRWFEYKDNNFEFDKFKGNQLIVELRMNF